MSKYFKPINQGEEKENENIEKAKLKNVECKSLAYAKVLAERIKEIL